MMKLLLIATRCDDANSTTLRLQSVEHDKWLRLRAPLIELTDGVSIDLVDDQRLASSLEIDNEYVDVLSLLMGIVAAAKGLVRR